MYHEGKGCSRLMCKPLEGRTMYHKFSFERNYDQPLCLSHDVRCRPYALPCFPNLHSKPYVSQIRICSIPVIDRVT